MRQNRLRCQAAGLGLALCTSGAKGIHLDNYGGYTIMHVQRNCVIAAERFELRLGDVEQWLASSGGLA